MLVRERALRRARVVRRSPAPAVDLGVYFAAIPVLLRNPTIIVVPLLMAVAGVLIGQLLGHSGGTVGGALTGGLAQLVVYLLQFFGVGAACIIADDAWRHRFASFDRGWEETSRRSGDILWAAIGFTLLLSVAAYAGTLLGPLSIVLMALAAYFLIWTLPAAALGGAPGGLSIQVSVDRVRSNPLTAAITLVASFACILLFGYLAGRIALLFPPTAPEIVAPLIGALTEAIAFGYIATILAKTYTNVSFGHR